MHFVTKIHVTTTLDNRIEQDHRIQHIYIKISWNFLKSGGKIGENHQNLDKRTNFEEDYHNFHLCLVKALM